MNSNARFLKKRFFAVQIPLYRKDPVLYAREVLRFEPDDWQKEALADLAYNPKVSIKSGQGVGKTGLEAVALLWFLTCFPYPRVVATAPTKQQLNDVLWSEVAKWMNRSPLVSSILRWTKTYIYMTGYEKRWFAVARTATKPENMQGFHEENMLFIVDEASGVADPIMEAILGTLTGINNKLLMCGNPTRTTGAFYDSHTKDKPLYRCHTVSSRDSNRTDKQNIDSMVKKYGKDSNVVRVRIDGEFPAQEDDVFIQLSHIEQSIKTEIPEDTINSKIYSIDIGVDVARYGDDKTCISYKVNQVVKIYKKYHGQNTTWTKNETAFLVKHLIRKYPYFKGCIPVKVDDGGVGGGVVDQLEELKKFDEKNFGQIRILPINFGVPIKHNYYHDSTTYMMSVIRDLICPFDDDGNPKHVELILPDDDDLVGQLSVRKYSFTPANKQKVESKDEIKKRGLPSPDEADSVLLACLPVRIK